MKKLAANYASFVIKNRNSILVAMGLLTLFFAYFIKDLDIRNDPDTLLPEVNRYFATNAY